MYHNFDTKSLSNHLKFLVETIIFLLTNIEKLDKDNSSLKEANTKITEFIRSNNFN